MEIDWTIVAFEALNFGVLVVILRRFLFRPVQRTLEQRRQHIEALQRETQEREATADATRKSYEDKLQELEREAKRRIDEAIADGRARAEAVMEQARQKGRTLVESADNEAELARRRALESLRREMFELATAAAARVVRHMGVSSVAHAYVERGAHALRDALSGEPKPDAITASIGDDIDASEVEAIVHEVLGRSVRVKVDVDPDIVAGVRLQTHGIEIEASASASLRTWYAEQVDSQQSESTFDRAG